VAASSAAQLSPATLHDAKDALDNAESSYTTGSDSDITRDKAYIALRKAELAEVVASAKLAKRDEVQAHMQTQMQKDQATSTAWGELAQAREQLATTDRQWVAGRFRPADHATAEGRANDRRVEIVILSIEAH
jgi:hypothetical protein